MATDRNDDWKGYEPEKLKKAARTKLIGKNEAKKNLPKATRGPVGKEKPRSNPRFEQAQEEYASNAKKYESAAKENEKWAEKDSKLNRANRDVNKKKGFVRGRS